MRGSNRNFMSLLVALATLATPGLSMVVPPQAVAQVVQAQGERKATADQLLDEGIRQFRISQFRAALQSWQQALEIYRDIGYRQGEAASLGNLGIAYKNLGQYEKAINFHQQSLAIKREIGDRQGEANSLGNLGNAYDSLGQYEKAINFHQQYLSIAREIGDRQGEANSLGNLGNAYNSLGQYEKAINFLKQTLTIAREIGNRQGEAASLGSLGNAYDSLGQYEKAINFHQQSLAIKKDIGNRQGEGKSLGNLGNAYNSLGQYEKAINFHQQSLSIARELGNRQGEANSLGNLGNAYDSLGQYEKAINFQQQQLTIAREIGDRQGEANALGNLGNAYYSLGQYEKAINFHQQSLSIAREIGDRQGEAISLGNLGNAYDSLGQYEKAINFHQQSLSIAREIGDRQGEAISLGNLGNAYDSLGQYEKAINFQQQQLTIAREIGDRQGEAISLNNLGATYDNLKQYPEAETNLFGAIQVYESLRETLQSPDQVSIFETQAVSYRTLQRVLIAQEKSHRALEIAERGRTRALIQILARQLSPQATTQLQIEIPQPPTIEQIQQIARQRQATLVEYSLIADKALLIWVVQPNGTVEVRTVSLNDSLTNLEQDTQDWLENAQAKATNQTQIAKLLRGTSATLGLSPSSTDLNPAAPPPPTNKTLLRQLHAYLIEPIADLLPQTPEERVIFIPHRELFRVPFAALTDAKGEYLIKKHTILIAPSIQALDFTRQHKQRVQGKASSSLIVGRPALPPGSTFPDLPGTEQEARSIAQQVRNSVLLLGKQATETAVRQHLHSARIIHLATHGVLSDAKDAVSPGKVILAQSKDGGLTSQELLEITLNNPLNAEMVVLSACKTGGGTITGDGIVGLSRSLIAAGVPSVVVSLWNVEDSATSELMQAFYTNLERKQMDKAQALRQAMLTILDEYPDPSSWAAFTLIGEPE